MSSVHQYGSRLRWEGSTGEGYERYSREHRVSAPPASAELGLSSDPAFGGDPDLLDPEQLFVMAASSCQLLSFLAVAARGRIDVVRYEDEAEGVMPEDDEPVRITRITLRPRIAIAGDFDEDRVRRLVEVAHRHCYVANSVTTEIGIEARIERA